MAMNDDETVALVAGGHTFGKAHGAAPDSAAGGREPEGAPMERDGTGLDQRPTEVGKGGDTITSGLEGAWTPNPTRWDMGYLECAVRLRMGTGEEPCGRVAVACRSLKVEDDALVVDAHDATKKWRPMMSTADMALTRGSGL
jgi:catalase-peroxidase